MMKPFPEIPHSSEGPGLTVSNTSGISIPVESELLQTLAGFIEAEENVRFQQIELVYIDENEMIQINREYLGKEYVTDIITFRLDENEHNMAIEGTLFCCARRITEQSTEFGTDIKSEFYRIFIHGLLHLAGYEDAHHDLKHQMTAREDHYLEQLNSLL